MSRRTPLPIAIAALAALLVACGPEVPPSDSVLGSASPGVVPPPTTDDLAAAVAALDQLDSYRFALTIEDGLADAVAQSRGVVVNGDVRRSRVQFSSGGAFTGGQITIGGRTWLSVAGSDYREEDVFGGVPDEWVNPVAQQFDPWSLGLLEVEDLGTGPVGGVDARHLRATATADDEVDEDGLATGSPFTGVADIWVATEGGHLVAATAEGTQAWPAPAEDAPAPSPTAYRLEIAIEGVDDPANVVDEPVAVAATPPPEGDPAAMALVRAIAKGQRALDSYVVSITSDTGGMALTETITVVNRPARAALLEYGDVAGFDGIAILVVGDRAWSRSGSGPWEPGRPTCGVGGDSMAEMEPCTFERLTDLSASIRELRETYTIVATDEELDGIPVTHLRSEAGLVQAGFAIPGTRDIWVANDGGHLVRDVFTGVGLSSELIVDGIDDPANVRAVPVP